MTERVEVGVTADMLTGPLGEALYAGRMRATMISKVSGDHVSLKFQCAFRESRDDKWQYNVTFADASRVFIDVSNSHDKVGMYRTADCMMFPEKNWQTGRVTADPVRYHVAWKLLMIAGGLLPMESDRYLVEQGKYCMRCGAELDEPESIARGLGPVCAQMVSASYGTRHQKKRARPAVPAPTLSSPSESVQEGLFVVRPGESLDDLYSRLANR